MGRVFIKQNSKNKKGKMKKSQYEELTMGISIIITLLAYQFGIIWLFYIFFVKSCFDCGFAIVEAIKELKKEKGLK